MFQTFAATTSPDNGPARLAQLRAQIATEGLDGFLVPRADAHQGEYVAACDERLAWLTGFTGSAGFAAVLTDLAGVFIDGRYRLQVLDQIADVFTPVHWPETNLGDWLIEQRPKGGNIGFDPWLHTVDEVTRLTKACADHNIALIPCDNLVDRIWKDRPAPPSAPFTAHPIEFAGESAVDKRRRVAQSVPCIITLPDSIAWLLNIRGTDIARNPVPQAFAILHTDGTVDLFADPGKTDAIRDHLGVDVTVYDKATFLAHLGTLSGPVQIDPKSCPQAVRGTLHAVGVMTQKGDDPCILPKARKNPVEIAGVKAAHLRDGAAMVRFLAWLDAEGPKGQLCEIDVVKQLENFRRDTNQLRDISFETICGAGAHGAIVHYRVTEETNAPVTPGNLLLVDSGGQYSDGTTDITRTIAIGTATDEHRACYTRVLQGMIAISRTRFPKGIAGQHLDALARFPLWSEGMDYDHGTGHGVGSYLSVHEGPQGISRRATVALEAGMILSNEPGYYRTGAFGIRIENLITVIPAPDLPGADQREMFAFETLTFVPLDRALIDASLLSTQERDWINGYHAQTQAKIAPLVQGDALDWLTAACAPL
jgi:Xaa-Pro aminopeptidase